MKKIIASLIILLSICTSCQFNQSVNKDLTTGAFSKGDGIDCDEIVIEVDGKAESKNEFYYGQKINFVFNNVTGLTRLDVKTYPELAMYIVKNEKDTLLSNTDLLKNLSNGTELSPLQLQTNFVAALPHKNDEKYKAIVVISDRKGDGKFTYELPFTIKENELLTLKSTGLTYSSIYLWDQTSKEMVLDSNINANHLFILIVEGIEGFKVTDGKVFPIFSVEMTDNSGTKIISDPNIYSEFETKGLPAEDFKRQIVAQIRLTPGQVNNPYTLTAQLKDKNSGNKIEIETKLNVK